MSSDSAPCQGRVDATRTDAADRLVCVLVRLTDDSVEVLLARWQKILGLMRDVRVPLGDVSEVRVVEDPIRETMGTGLKVGLRLPWLYYVARTIRLDRAFVVRRAVPGLPFAVRNQDPLRSVLVSTPRAQELAVELAAAAPRART
jgi:hypothetical protein